METRERILDCMNRALKIDNANELTSQQNCDNWDSMNQLNLIIELEAEFDIELEPEEIGMMTDFASIRKVTEAKGA